MCITQLCTTLCKHNTQFSHPVFFFSTNNSVKEINGIVIYEKLNIALVIHYFLFVRSVLVKTRPSSHNWGISVFSFSAVFNDSGDNKS